MVYNFQTFASSGPQLPKIPSFHKFARREQYGQMDEFDLRRKWSGGVLGRQDCISEIDSRNCRVRDWSLDFSAACVNLDNSRTADNLSQRSHSNEIACQLNLGEHSGESAAAAADSSIFTKAWVDTAGSVGIKDYHAIERWQSQAAAADSDFFHPAMHIKDEEDSNTSSKPRTWKHDRRANESSVSQVTINNESLENRSRGADRIKQAVVDYVASLLMPLYKARKIDRDGYKTIMKKSATKVMEQATDAEKNMAVSEFLDFKRKNKIRSFVDKLIERHMAMKPTVKIGNVKLARIPFLNMAVAFCTKNRLGISLEKDCGSLALVRFQFEDILCRGTQDQNILRSDPSLCKSSNQINMSSTFSGDETAPFFGFLGAAAALVFSCMGAAYGTAKSGVGVASMGVMRPELVMKSIVPVVMAGVLGIYGLIIAVIISTGINPKAKSYYLFDGYAHLSSGLACGLAGLSAGMAIGIVGDAGVRANAQQPKLFVGMILILIFAEALALYGLIVGIILSSRAGQSRAD
ncbi:hypothetical protein Pint_09072 [Pistacia integerrima]|uniref:Uncharacterized protein n=1 Tax=Pistacia integerrima TaxID=434235 RepID=A0ACC0XVI7_9ROSI|nr:hypothetical protein Pint_09072 [Pistacia integerrima]